MADDRDIPLRSRLRPPRPGELTPRTAAHFLATVRGACVGNAGTGVVVRGRESSRLRVTIPLDGAWFYNGAWQVPGMTLALRAGDVLSYRPTHVARDAGGEDDRPVEPVAAIGLFDAYGRPVTTAGAGPAVEPLHEDATARAELVRVMHETARGAKRRTGGGGA